MPTPAERGRVSRGSILKAPEANRVVYIPSIRNSPWAKFTMSIIPKMIVKPRATRANIVPIRSPDVSDPKRISICNQNPFIG